MPETVAVLGASPKPERYSHQAIQLLRQYGHTVIPVNPAQAEIAGLPVAASVTDIRQPVDTVTLYVSPAHQGSLEQQLKTLKPRRVIFNPGTENPSLAARLRDAGMETEEACTLVLLRTRQF